MLQGLLGKNGKKERIEGIEIIERIEGIEIIEKIEGIEGDRGKRRGRSRRGKRHIRRGVGLLVAIWGGCRNIVGRKWGDFLGGMNFGPIFAAKKKIKH